MFSNNNFEMNSVIDGNNNIIENEMNIDVDVMQNQTQGGTVSSPITEPLKERCVHRTIVHEVPHV